MAAITPHMRLLTYQDLKALRGVSYTREHLRALIKRGEFPAPVRVGAQRIAWRADEIDAWIASRERVSYRAARK
jgi:prophage regulatory protein